MKEKNKFNKGNKVMFKNQKVIIANYAWCEHMDEYIYTVKLTENSSTMPCLERELKEINGF